MEDTKEPQGKQSGSASTLHLYLSVFFFLLAALALMVFTVRYLVTSESDAPDITTTASVTLPQPAASGTTNLEQTIEVTEGDTLADIFDRYNLDQRDLSAVLSMPNVKTALRHIKPGNQMQLMMTPNGALEKLSYQIGSNQFIKVARTQHGFISKTVTETLEVRKAVAQGVVRSSFYSAAQNAGLPTSLILDLGKIFAWHVNFKQGLHPGDTFEVLYEERYLGDKFIEYGDILAAKFYVNGELFEAIRFKPAKGIASYYTPTGNSLDRAFMRVPLKYTRISSSFNLNRKHPLLGITRPHEGVDLAANWGTPVTATGNGVISFEGKEGGYGNLVIVNHGQGITTRYGHLSRFVKGLHAGDHVSMGQVIAYVGSTGLATGPHLHYEYRINEAPQNPLTVKLPGTTPLPAKYRKSFLAQTRVYLAEMDKAISMPYQLTELG